MTSEHILGRTAITLLVASGFAPAHAESFSLTGQYEGMYACDSTTGGVPSSWSDPMTRRNSSGRGSHFHRPALHRQTRAWGGVFALYRVGCSGTQWHAGQRVFRSLRRHLPIKGTGPHISRCHGYTPFSFSVTSVWASDQVPNLPGLTVQTCTWSLKRVSTETPKVRPCETAER